MVNRLLNLRQKMAQQDIQAVLIDKRQDCTYLSGFLGDESFLFITQDNAYIITDFRYVEQAQKEAKDYEILRVEHKIWQMIQDIMKKECIKRVGIQEENITYTRYKQYRENLVNLEFVNIDGLLKQIRMIKTNDEIEIIRKAVEIADSAFSHILGYIKVGVTEEEVALELEYFMKKNKASGVSFETIVASGLRSSMPHGIASSKVIEYNDVVTLDYGAIYNNYCSDMTRTIFVGPPKKEIVKIYDIVKKAQLQGINHAKRGVLASDVDKVARDVIEDMGYGRYFGHSLGHGVGMEVHEEPKVSKRGDVSLENGMVITIEPGIYIPNIGGVRIEDMIVIDHDKPEILTKSTKDIVVID